MRAIIIDDELKSREVLGKLIHQFFEGIDVIAGSGDIQGAITVIQHLKPDLVFLDISLQDGDSFSILNKLPEIDFKIIFITAFDEYATQAILFTQIPCLHKPLDIDELGQALLKVKNQNILSVREDVSIILNILNSTFSIIPIMDIFKVTFVDASIICMIKKENGESLFIDKKYTVTKSWCSFDKYIRLLKGHDFAQPNENILLNLSNLRFYPNAKDDFLTVNFENKAQKLEVAFSQDYKVDFLKRYAKHYQKQ